MPIKDVFKVSRKTFINPSAWIGYKSLSNGTKAIWGVIKDTITPDKPQRQETFEQAMQRFKLTETDIQKQSKDYFFYSISFVLLAAFSFMASFYFLFIHKTFAGLLLGFAVTALFLAQAFRFNFWHFQIKHRKLGCTFDEWRHGRTIDRKESK